MLAGEVIRSVVRSSTSSERPGVASAAMPASELNRWWSVVSASPTSRCGPSSRSASKARRTCLRMGRRSSPSTTSASSTDRPSASSSPARRGANPASSSLPRSSSTPWPGSILRSFDQIPIRRGQGDVDALEEAIRTVAGGAIAAIAPEGRVNDDGATEMLRFHRGVARLALATERPSCPSGSGERSDRWPRSGRRYGEAVASPARVRLRRCRGPAAAIRPTPTTSRHSRSASATRSRCRSRARDRRSPSPSRSDAIEA